MSARELAAAGLRVTVLERGRLGREASWAGGGILSPLYPWRQPDAVNLLARTSQSIYPHLVSALAEESGVDPQWTPSGFLVLDETEAQVARSWAERFGAELEVVSAHDARVLEPSLGAIEGRAVWLRDVAQVRPPRLMRALARSLCAQGVLLREGVEVRGLDIRGGRVRGVHTAEERIEASRVVVAAGAWSNRVLAPLGGLALEPVRGQMLLLRAEPGTLRRILLRAGRYVIPRRDGHVLAGSTLERVGFDRSTSESALAELREAAGSVAPALKASPVAGYWAGLRPGSPEGVPWIGSHPGAAGVYVNAGHHRAGLLLAPAAARLLADLVVGREPCVPAAAYRVDAARAASG